MSTPGSPPSCDGMYSKLIDDEGPSDDFGCRPDVAQMAPAVHPVRLSGLGPYRLATICLAVLSAVLLISIIGITAHYKNKTQSGAEVTSDVQNQTQDANVSALTATVLKLQQEKNKLQKEKDELEARLAATKAPDVIEPTTKPASVPVTCPSDWHLFNNSCYLIFPIPMDWLAGQRFCQTQGGHLAIIHTAEEQTFVWNLLPRGHWNAYWIGITDGHTEDQWKWVDGTPLVGGFWEIGAPNNHIDEDCGFIVKTLVLERVAIQSWHDAPCSLPIAFICEKKMNVTTAQ
ncbi:hypothetical protein Q5P01_018716 [Channa striata]|uniref:C-type lectin domain-containing protein n=1 Tax=Channa striata TaxID=64152 RepID=A0AA88M4Z1_CHASR|nr:hypothetical protein Q5P01_018716 [Channa striata]